MADKIKNPETIGLHGGEYRSDPATTAVAVPIYQTTSYQFKDAKTAANLFGLKEFGKIFSYTRILDFFAGVCCGIIIRNRFYIQTNEFIEKRTKQARAGQDRDQD